MTIKDLQKQYDETDFGNHESTAALFKAINDYLAAKDKSESFDRTIRNLGGTK